MDTAKDIEKYTTDTQSLIDSIGDISNGSVHDIIDKYDQISKDWNSFLDDQGAKYGLTFDPKQTDQEKIDMISERSFYDEKQDKGFLSSLQQQIKENESDKENLTRQAQELLDTQKQLVEKNNLLIEDLKRQFAQELQENNELQNKIDSMQAEKDEKQQLKDKCEQLDSALEFKINQKRAELSSIENELSKLNPKDPEYQAKSDEKSKLESELDGLHDERSNNKKELADYDDAIKSLDADITSSTAQHTAKDNELNGPDGKHDKINSLENKNKDLSKHLEENRRDFDAKGIAVNAPLTEQEKAQQQQQQTQQNPQAQTQQSQSQNQQTQKSQGKVVAGAAPAQSQQAEEKTALTETTDKERAKRMCQEFREAKTTDERRKVIDGYGYTDIVAMSKYLNIFDRKRMFNTIREEIDSIDIPDKADFDANMAEILKNSNSKALQSLDCYSLLFANNAARDFKSMSTEELRNIQKVFDEVNKSRNLIGKENPELLEYFDKNFAQFAKTGSLMEKVKTGRIKGFFADMFNGKQKAVRDKLTGSMRDYTQGIQNEKVNKAKYENSIRVALGQEVIEVPTAPSKKDRVSPDKDSLITKLDKQSATYEKTDR